MSSDYRPRGGSSSSGGGDSSRPRRRRGGRNRGGAARSGEHRPHHTNGTPSAPAKKENPIAKLFGWLTGKKKKPESKPASVRTPRPEFRDKPREPREPRAERPQREELPKEDPTPQEIVSPKLYVGNLAYEAVEHDLFDLFSKVGSVKNVEIAMDRHANRSKGFGFVEMETLDTAKEASAKLNRTDFMGRQIVVSGAKMERRSVNNREVDAGGASEEIV
jgi:RNA recognition motif-containing protein